MSTDELASSLRGGASLSDLATQKGVSRDDLLATITKGLEANTSESSTGPTVDVQALAAKIADHKGVPGHHRRDHHSQASGGSANDLSQKLADLSAALGISSDQLVQALQSGLSSLAGSNGPASASSPYGVSAALLQGLQVDQLA